MGEDVTTRFDSIEIDQDTQDVILKIREMFKALAAEIDAEAHGRAASLALTALQESSMWATRAISEEHRL